jgi:hypothetical protein
MRLLFGAGPKVNVIHIRTLIPPSAVLAVAVVALAQPPVLRDGLETPIAYAQTVRRGAPTSQSADRLYEAGRRALDKHQWTESLNIFSQIVADKGARGDGASYWKAYSLNKLGRPDEALAAIAEMRKSYGSSSWLNDAKALELEIKETLGKPSRPEDESDDELRLIALAGLMHSDPGRAFPIIEKFLKSVQSPRIQERLLFLLAETNFPQAQTLLEQTARGRNPDLQILAIRYLRNAKTEPPNHLFSEVYASTNDTNVKRAVLDSLYSKGRAKELVDLARSERDTKLQWEIVNRLSHMTAKEAIDYMVEILQR